MRTARITTLALFLLSAAAFAAEPVTFKAAVTPPAGKAHRGAVKVTVTPAPGMHINSGGSEMTFKVSAKPRTFTFGYTVQRESKKPAKAKIDVSYIYCTGNTGTCNFASKTLIVTIPKAKK
jgi:hypothetical protein